MSKIKIIISYPLGFILSIITVLIVLCLILKVSVFSPSFIKKEFNKTSYYKSIHTEIVEGMKDYVAPTGLPDSIIDGVVSESEVKTEIDNYINAILNGKNYEVNTGDIEGKVKKNVDDYLTKHNVKMDETEEFSRFVSDLEKVYVNEVKLYKVLDKYVGLYPKLNKYIKEALLLLSIAFVVVLIMLLICRSRIISSSIMSSGFILILFRLFIIEDVNIENVSIFNDYFSLVIRNIFSYFSEKVLFLGIIISIFGFFISLFASNRKITLKKH